MEIAKVLEPELLIEVGLKEPEAPVGSPLTDNATLALKPVPAVTVAL